MTQKACCPACGGSELRTVETIIGTCGVTITRDPWTNTPRLNFDGETQMFWDTSTTIGIECACGWDYRGDDWIDQLIWTDDE
jgi:hypothetical protein